MDYKKIARERLLGEGMEEGGIALAELFVPRTLERIGEAHHEAYSFVYYTTAETAIKIFEKGEVWLRNALVMNDYSELSYGHELLNNEHSKIFGDLAILYKDIFNQPIEEFMEQANKDLKNARFRSWISCLSEYDEKKSPDRENLGRLSMWRAYGGNAGVAIVFNPTPITQAVSHTGLLTFPVHYANPEAIRLDCERLLSGIADNKEMLRNTPKADFDRLLSTFYDNCLLGTKHPGFYEEREWRVVYRPDTLFGKSKPLRSSVETIRGVPQVIYKYVLKDGVSGSSGSFTFQQLVKKVIVGPCEQESMISDALAHSMTTGGFKEPWNLITQSGIPLRQT